MMAPIVKVMNEEEMEKISSLNLRHPHVSNAFSGVVILRIRVQSSHVGIGSKELLQSKSLLEIRQAVKARSAM